MIQAVFQYKWLLISTTVAIGILFFLSNKDGKTDILTTIIERGDVQEVVSVSGFVEAVKKADLGFPASGRVTGIFVAKGDTVAMGDMLATLGSATLAAERERLNANLANALAAREELKSGPTSETRAVTESTIDQARTALQQTIATELTKVQNALIALRSTNLQAYALDEDENAIPPTISGSYTCTTEGMYELEAYPSRSQSGYSFRLHGIESGNYSITTNQPAALGECGLYIQFTDNVSYASTDWEIPIPNTRGETYLTLKNNYELANEQALQNIAAARAALTLAEDKGTAADAAPRVEALLQANANVLSAQAAVAGIDAQLQDQSIIAPFNGTITNLNLQEGEITRSSDVFTLVATDDFSITARVPEIDITKITVGQPVKLTFDAMTNETIYGEINFVSPVATEIDGVGYFETTITLDDTPHWLRAGLNADIDIIIAEKTNVLRIPTQYLTTNSQGSFVTTIVDNRPATTSVDIGLTGNDGYVEITNLSEGTTIVVP